MIKLIYDIVIIGAGNLAWQLTKELKHYGQNIVQVYNRSLTNAKELSKQINCEYTSDINCIDKTADIYFILTSDRAISDISKKLNLRNKFVVHSSGSINLNKIQFKRRGVFYPLQTFSKNTKVDFKQIPICIETNTKKDYKILLTIANLMSNHVIQVNSKDRQIIHMAAVFANNFTNYMYVISNEILKNNKINFKILHPLINETNKKIRNNTPKKSQTGPALRQDFKIIRKHLSLLDNKQHKKIYKILSLNISKIISK